MTGHRHRVDWHTIIVVVKKNNALILFTLGWLCVACTGGQTDTSSGHSAITRTPPPTTVETGPGFGLSVPPPGSPLQQIDGSAPGDVWAVGELHDDSHQRSLIEHWDGSLWHVMDGPNVGALGDVSVVSSDDVWAVSHTSVIHWNGSRWDSTNLSKGNARSLTSISATGPNDVWVAGERPGFKVGANANGWSTLVMHFDGHSWSEENTPDQGSRDNYLNGIEAVSPTDVWVAGYSVDLGPHTPEGTTLAIHYDGSRWSLVSPPNPSRSLNIIWGMGTDNATVWALGDYRGPDRHLTPLILGWTGTAWHQLPLHGDLHWSATSAAGAFGARTWVVGSEPTSSFAVASCDLSACRTSTAPDGNYDMQATSVLALSETDAWLVGSRNARNGTTTPIAERWDGSTWTDIEVPTGLR